MGVSCTARQLFLVLEPALGLPLIQDLLARCIPRQGLVAPVGLPFIAPRAHRHAVELLRISVAEQPSLTAKRAGAIELVGLDSLPRRAGSGVRRLAAGARRRARVVVERAGRHRHLGPQRVALELCARHRIGRVGRRMRRRVPRNLVSHGHGARPRRSTREARRNLTFHSSTLRWAPCWRLARRRIPTPIPPRPRPPAALPHYRAMESDAPARALSSTERKKRQLYNPGTATWTDDKPASPGGRRALWEALAGPAPPPPPVEPEPEDSGLKFTNATPAAELLAPVFTALQVASLCPGASPSTPPAHTSRLPLPTQMCGARARTVQP